MNVKEEKGKISCEVTKSVISLAVLILCEAFFFRNILSGQGLIGDYGDGRLTALLTEHWWKVLRGKEGVSELAMFYPAKDCLGYTDLLLFFSIFHCFFRSIGCSLYKSYSLSMISVHFFGTLSMFYLLKRKMHCNSIWSIFGTIAFCFSSTFSIQICHTQLNAISMLPVLLILLLGTLENMTNEKTRKAYILAMIGWYALIVYTSWYIAFFTLLFLIVFVTVFIVMKRNKIINILQRLGALATGNAREILIYILFAILLMVPFIRVYYPVLSVSRGYSYSDCLEYILDPKDLVYMSRNSLLGALISTLVGGARPEYLEHMQAFPIALIITLVFLIILFTYGLFVKSEHNKTLPDMCILIIYTICASILMIIKIPGTSLSIWGILYYVCPLFRSVRAVGRFAFFLSFPLALFVSYCMNNQYTHKHIVPIVLCVLAYLSGLCYSGVYSSWNETDEERRFRNISAPHYYVEAFYLMDEEVEEGREVFSQVDAFDIANRLGIKTINGYSGQFPPDWGLWDMADEDYEMNCIRWAADHNLSSVYAYDINNNRWVSINDRIKSQIGNEAGLQIER